MIQAGLAASPPAAAAPSSSRFVELHGTIEAAAKASPATGEAGFRAGDAATLTLHATVQGPGTVDWPTREGLESALGGKVTVLGEGTDLPPHAPDASLGLRDATLHERSWPIQLLMAPGPREVGPVPLTLVDGASQLDSGEVPPVTVSITSGLPKDLASVLDHATDAESLGKAVTQSLAPVRGPWALRSNVPWGLLIGLLVVLAALAAAWLWWRRRRPRVAAIPALPPEPAEVRARRRLQALLAAGYLDRGEMLAFHVELADLLKSYLGDRYAVDFLERTTDEVRWMLAGALRDGLGVSAVRSDVLAVLAACDVVKFARFTPARSDALAAAERTDAIIARTTPVPLPEPASDVPHAPQLEGAA